MNVYEIKPINELLESNTYPGRGIVIGKSADGKSAAVAYFIMGRSENSRNRIFSEKENGEVITVTEDLPKSFLLTSEFGMDRVYLCQFNAATLEKRMK